MNPIVNPDTTYHSQRYDRLVDAVDDYLTDEDISSERFYKDLLEAIKNGADYHDRYARKYHESYLKVCGLLKDVSVPPDEVSTIG